MRLLQLNVLARSIVDEAMEKAGLSQELIPAEIDRLKSIVKLIKHTDPDVVNVQELDFGMLRYFLNNLSEYTIVAADNSGGMDIRICDQRTRYYNFTNAVLFKTEKYKMIDSELFALDGMRRLIKVVLMPVDILADRSMADTMPICIFNAHYPIMGGGKKRIECAKTTTRAMEKAEQDYPGSLVVFSGDTNLLSHDLLTPLTVKLFQKDYKVQPAIGTPTFHAWPHNIPNEDTPPSTLDYIIANQDFVHDIIWVPMVGFSFYVSDHCAIIAEFD